MLAEAGRLLLVRGGVQRLGVDAHAPVVLNEGVETLAAGIVVAVDAAQVVQAVAVDPRPGLFGPPGDDDGGHDDDRHQRREQHELHG